MRAEELRNLAAQEESHWWFRARRRIVGAVLSELRWQSAPTAALDLGCGAGIDLERLPLGARLRVGLDRAEETLGAARARLQTESPLPAGVGAPGDPPGGRGLRAGSEKAEARADSAPHFVRADGERLPLRDSAFDLALALDVLEHLDDDAAALAEARRVLRPGGRLLITVPAWPALWSEHDVALAHRRRYRRRDLLRRVEAAGFAVERETYFNTLLFTPVAAYRVVRRAILGSVEKRSGSEPASDTLRLGNRAGRWLETVLAAERLWLARRRLPFGLSLLVVGRRR